MVVIFAQHKTCVISVMYVITESFAVSAFKIKKTATHIDFPFELLVVLSGSWSGHRHHHGVCGFPGGHGDPGRVPNPLHPSTW